METRTYNFMTHLDIDVDKKEKKEKNKQKNDAYSKNKYRARNCLLSFNK